MTKPPKSITRALATLFTKFVTNALTAEVAYLRAENKVWKDACPDPKLTDKQRKLLARNAKKLRAASPERFEEVVSIRKPDTVARWINRFIDKTGAASEKDAAKQDEKDAKVGRPKTPEEIEALVVKIGKETESGLIAIQNRLRNLGVKLSRSTIRGILDKNGIPTNPQDRKYDKSWVDFMKTQADVIWGVDFFSHNVRLWYGLATFYVIVFIHHGSRKLVIGGFTQNPTQEWVAQQANNFFMRDNLPPIKYLIRDRDGKYGENFDSRFESEIFDEKTGRRVEVKLATCPQMNGKTERVIQAIKMECLRKIILFGEDSLRRALRQYEVYFNTERNHQGRNHEIPFAGPEVGLATGEIKCRERLGGLLRYYYRAAA